MAADEKEDISNTFRCFVSTAIGAMKLLPRLLAVQLLSILLIGKCVGYVRLTNLKCESLDPAFMEFPTCRLNVLGRGIIGGNIHLKLLKVPITKMNLRFNVYRRLSGYHPFLFNISTELCRFMKNPNPLQVFYYFHSGFLPYSNVNHTCPYTDDVFIRNCTLNDEMFKRVPLPKGNYMLTLAMDNGARKRVGIISIYIEIDLD
ncbi:uncharacterized protein [Drosophila pseudoobscura]|uniref:MD-2-related lipid-recognition domain-containing protein n=1 Tax=Drosophila pseudoobscura pseudoobscura TaxID=46245 RepID=A0A6I8VGG8_DROPS|nr:uncharacterized protein LOC6898698 [Drosophila pseudoobscura]